MAMREWGIEVSYSTRRRGERGDNAEKFIGVLRVFSAPFAPPR
jgi:hypothetical protein